MNISIGADHRGFECKRLIIQNMTLAGVKWLDVGCFSSERCDYPKYAKLVAKDIIDGRSELGVLLCGSGVGMSIAANRFVGIRAGLCWNIDVARAAKEDDDINVLVLPTDFVTPEQSLPIINAWLNAKFKGQHYQQRLDMLD